MKYVYPAVFTPEPDGGYSIDFPDLASCYTQGDTIEDGYLMAEDVLCLKLCAIEDAGEKPAPASSPADTTEYRRITDGRAVKKTLSIPNWLNVAAEREGVNFSAVLQDALKARLGIS